MALSRRRNTSGENLHVWPGYVDALSTLLMVIIFVLLVFVLAQAFLSYTLAGKEHRLDELNRQLAIISRQFALEQQHSTQLAQSLEQLRNEVAGKEADIARLRTQTGVLAEQKSRLESQLAGRDQDVKRAEAKLAELDQTIHSKDTALDRLRDDLEAIRHQLAAVQSALDASEKESQSKDRTIADLGMRLNVALAEKVEELKKYRSEFFGKLREVLAGRPGIQVVGDRFVFQSDVLFPSGSADLTEQGRQQVKDIAAALIQLSKKFPSNVNWLLRVDGHADRQKMVNGKFASNWELSAQRAINVARLLIEQGVPGNHVSADAFADYQPVSQGNSEADLAKNRRIELRLTDR
ncbi:Chemotaxis motB protein [Granulibacter bethesdensis]|uniref:Chemotaxis motB protein n=1 Tax=Granulibacter bethesdensis TaxID=364410 RepID=A0AAC9KE12_9PROT|nr:peptidoglycan -binding protein [Granulibacter bethesdensis]APH54360.1 Chemotaxis motB protein [Granulibacter bethesdensis]APH61945.1 Chemotaxis motB protein [Granulibacter bethesdensis]